MIRQPDSAMPTRGSSTVQELSLARRLHTSLSVSAPRLSEASSILAYCYWQVRLGQPENTVPNLPRSKYTQRRAAFRTLRVRPQAASAQKMTAQLPRGTTGHDQN
eukprot:198715-Rhodomonas_salina.4